MKNILSLFLTFTLLINSKSLYADPTASNVETIVNELEGLGLIYQKKCLPKDKSEIAIKKHHEKNGVSEECWKLITRINHLDNELQKIKNQLEAKVSCENSTCKEKDGTLNSQITDLKMVTQAPMCTAERKMEIKRTCNDELTCVFVGTITGPGGYLAENILPNSMKQKNCNLGDDNCITQLATGFISAAITFFKGSWELLKLAGNTIGKKVKNLWEKVVGAEDHSSNSQLALAKASEDKGIFDLLTNDFPGTMNKIWQTFVAATKEWLKNDIFCQRWDGTPHSKKATCVRPSESFDCISCKTTVNGMCAIGGTLAAEIVPAFLTGGLFTAIEYGVSGAGKISKLFKVSESTISAIQASQVGKLAREADSVLKISTGVRGGRKVAITGISLITKYSLSPLRKGLKTSYTVISDLMRTGGPKLASTPIGKVIVFSNTILKNTFKVVLYPIDNPMTAMAYRTGGKSIEKVIALGTPKLPAKTAAVIAILERKPELESIFIKMREAELAGNTEKIRKLEEVVYANVASIRREAVSSLYMKERLFSINDIIRSLYPELKYGSLARTLSSEKVLEAERELYFEIEKIKKSATKVIAFNQYSRHVSQANLARKSIVQDAKPPYRDKRYSRPVVKTSELDAELAENLKHIVHAANVKPFSKISVSIIKDAKGKLVYTIDRRLDTDKGQAIIDAIAKSKNAESRFTQELAVNGNRVDLMIPVSTDGKLQPAVLEVQTVNVYIRDPINSTSRWPSGIVKVTSPTLKNAGAEKDKREKSKDTSKKMEQ